MLKKIIFFYLLLIQATITQGQVNLKLTSESIHNYSNPQNGKGTMKPIGKVGDSTLFFNKNNESYKISFYLLNEETFTFHEVFQEFNLEGRNVYISSSSESFVFYSKNFYENDEDYGFSKLFIHNGKTSIYLDSIFNGDKNINSSFSSDGKLLIINTLNDLPDYYNPSQDNGFFVYSIDILKNGTNKKMFLDCLHCSNGYIINDYLFFSKSNQRDDFSEGFSWKDIYYAPFEKIKDSIKIASYSKILAVSPDGKFILAERFFDLPNGPLAIIDVETKKYQLLIGRDYQRSFPFYSNIKGKFAFHFGNKIVYVDLPDEYPFDALQMKNEEIPPWGDPIYKKLKHTSLE